MLEPRRTRESFIDDENIERPLSRRNLTDSLTTPAEPIEPNLLTRDDSELTEDDEEIEPGVMEPRLEHPRGADNRYQLNEDRQNFAASRNLETPDRSSQDVDAPQNGDASLTPLFSEFEVNDLRTRWGDVQAGFVDSPRRSVEQADQLVAAVMQRIADSFAEERSALEKQWDRGYNASTEDLRVALQRYRAFFGRLLNAA